MKTKKSYWQALLPAMLGIIVWFPSCDNATENRFPGETIAAEFTVSCAPFGSDSEPLARSARNRIAETVEIPLEDNWFLSATLEEEAPLPMRVDYNSITNEAKFRVVAYEKSGSSYTYHADAEYTYTSPYLTSTSPIMVEWGKTYKYV
jgi:hypothetical protein